MVLGSFSGGDDHRHALLVVVMHRSMLQTILNQSAKDYCTSSLVHVSTTRSTSFMNRWSVTVQYLVNLSSVSIALGRSLLRILGNAGFARGSCLINLGHPL